MVIRSLKHPVTWRGIGVHTGEPSTVTLRPVPIHQWQVIRKDLGTLWLLRRRTASRTYEWPVNARNIVRTRRATSIGEEGVHVSTLEHLLAALMGLRVGSLIIEVEGPEIPFLDGSAQGFVETLRDVVQDTDVPWPTIPLRETVVFKDERGWIRAEPDEDFFIEYTIVFDHPLIGRQTWAGRWSEATFVNDIAPARTFGFVDQASWLHMQGMARGASETNTILLTRDGLQNPPLRFPDEFVRHKVLDLVGDLALLGGGWPKARIQVYRGGHRLHAELIRRWHTLEVMHEVTACQVDPGAFHEVAEPERRTDPTSDPDASTQSRGG